MNDALEAAAAYLKTTQFELELAKAQLHNAEAAYQSAKHIHGALGASQTAAVLGSESHSERLHALLKPRDTAIYFASDADGKPWYIKAGIDTSLSSCPFVWLQTGAPTTTGEPHICITFKPAFYGDTINQTHSSQAIPRRREALEAFNGSVNYELVSLWLQKCSNEHGHECQVDDNVSGLPVEIYLIDVKKRALVRHRKGDRFVALSYVWGKESRSDRSDTIPGEDIAIAIKENGEIDEAQELATPLPQTMEDAIRFVKHIGERLLWIDQICINQRLDGHKQEQINIMDQIFASAFLTLVSLDGPNADWGLPGVSRPLLQTQQPTVRLDQGQLMATFIYSNWDNHGKSVWDSRGWTLQERLLFRKCIIFAKTHVSMTCRTEFFHDCLALDSTSKGVETWLGDDFFREDGSGINLDDTDWDFKNYDALISVFTGRELTYPSDILRACQGSLNRLSHKASVEFLFGLPMNDLHRALVWVPHNAHVLARRSGFPSWSWTGWKGRIEYLYWVGDMAAYVDEDPRLQKNAPGSILKRKRTEPLETYLNYAQRAQLLTCGVTNRSLMIETTSTKFKLRLVRRDGEVHRNLKSNSQQSKTAIGDQWTLIGQDNAPLRDEAGEYPSFELTDSFFRLKPEYSEMLVAQGTEADFIFVEHWPCIRDSAGSAKWLYNMVSALLIIRNIDGTAWRLASALLKAEDWYAKNPQSENICLV
ncbi:uncharacterized protein KY384_003350 [Bacidia gigantensis]|uniref:uncharacterized protein n=1 Tax=Bacidia gigantensis TaxID=2732470 RepID=UPI001D0362B1|nr:uncharacterized protein KY384_003350 [Bacidia gigantensis]KAG8531718.1 hypothetical protein KY384_003350 [Bacidia gigantensis]